MPPLGPEQSRWFADEVHPHEAALRGWLRAKFPSFSDVDDIVQETYMRLLRAREAGKVRCARNYLYSIARNAALDHFRHQQVRSRRMAETDGLHVLDGSPNAAETASHDEELALLADAIQTLPNRCREVLILRKLYGHSHREIATRLGITENTVAATLSAGMRRCLQYFRERGAGE